MYSDVVYADGHILFCQNSVYHARVHTWNLLSTLVSYKSRALAARVQMLDKQRLWPIVLCHPFYCLIKILLIFQWLDKYRRIIQ